jgi:hypothetical protein
MISDWKTEIAVAWKVLQTVQDADWEGLWAYHLPRVAASEQELHDTEEILGFGLDPMFRAFLTYANGWPDFHHSADLFGTDELRGGQLMGRAEEMLSVVDSAVWNGNRVSHSDVLPLAVSKHSIDVFAIVRPSCDSAGQVIWLAGEVVERFANFDEFFLTMVDYNRLEARRLAERGCRRNGAEQVPKRKGDVCI